MGDGPCSDDWEYYDPDPDISDVSAERRRTWRRSHFSSLGDRSWDQAKHEARQTISKGRKPEKNVWLKG